MPTENKLREATMKSKDADLHINFWPPTDRISIWLSRHAVYSAKATDFIAELSKLGFAVPLRGPEAKLVDLRREAVELTWGDDVSGRGKTIWVNTPEDGCILRIEGIEQLVTRDSSPGCEARNEARSEAENESLSGVTLEEYTKWANSIDASRQDAEITDNDSDYRNTE